MARRRAPRQSRDERRRGLSSTLGVAAFPDGIVYRVGDPAPGVYIARLAISQTIGLGGGKVTNEAGPNELAGKRDRDDSRSPSDDSRSTDVFDGNRYANDATSEFFNWALFASGAWDYPRTRAATRRARSRISQRLVVGARAASRSSRYYANLAQMDWRLDEIARPDGRIRSALPSRRTSRRVERARRS